jgi:ElaB/YqjD/DUF883 family membrane-anchored ribosome-binding protein
MVDNPLDKAQAKVEETVEAVREFKDNAVNKADEYRKDAVVSVQEKPLQTLAIAAVIGFVVGAIWKS